ncbi:anthranilate N-methyltransferase-like [Senna tora]|uniref:Anthranilate N-methyltransferase-like n=1 Tax=Senna tora TaxID=362788 RepID=A0A835CIP8_9FABA|nr:anthranilate N-methyltransferase-like [Senna tora]
MAHEAAVNQTHHIDDEEESFAYAMQIALSTVTAFSVQTATELGVFDVIDEAGPDAELSAGEIASRLACKNPEAPSMLDRLLCLLASHSVLRCSAVADESRGGINGGFRRLYGLAPVARFFVKNADGVSLGPFIALAQDHKVSLGTWAVLKDAILEGGIAFDKLYGSPMFEYTSKDKRYGDLFNQAMINQSTIVLKKILETYKGFEGVEHVMGDMFESVPKGDAIFLKWILHNWGDEQCVKLLKNCYEALPDDGKVIVVEAVLPIVPNTSASVKSTSQFDVLMMAFIPAGGRERSEQEFTNLATSAGFSGVQFKCFVRNLYVMEFFK